MSFWLGFKLSSSCEKLTGTDRKQKLYIVIIFRVTGKRTFPTLKSGDPALTHSGIVLDQDFKWKIYLNTY